MKMSKFLLNRNFLDEISYEVVDWLRDEEAKYQADLLAQEVQTYARQATPGLETIKAAAAAIEAGGKKGKGAAGKSIVEIFFDYLWRENLSFQKHHPYEHQVLLVLIVEIVLMTKRSFVMIMYIQHH